MRQAGNGSDATQQEFETDSPCEFQMMSSGI